MSWTSAKSSETSRKWVSFSGCLCWFQGQLCRIALSVSEMSLKSHEYIRSHTNNLTFSYCIGQGSPKKRNYLHIYVLLVQSLSHVRLFATPWTAAHQASLSISNSQSLLKLTSIESVMPSSHLILCHPFLLLSPITPSIKVFSSESTPHMRWLKYWEFQLQHQSFHWTPRTDLL